MTLKSLSIFVGTYHCNANCEHCAGVPLRKHAPEKDGIMNKELIYKTLRKCYEKGARSLSISSSGEPTLSPISVTKTLELIYNCKKSGINYTPINLYSNGIRIGNDEMFSAVYLPMWNELNLKNIYVTVHNVDEKKNAKIYGIQEYPQLEKIVSKIHKSNMNVRANIVLNKKTIATEDDFIFMVEKLIEKGFDKVSAWPIRNQDDKPDKILAPNQKELDKMESWIQKKTYKNK